MSGLIVVNIFTAISTTTSGAFGLPSARTKHFTLLSLKVPLNDIDFFIIYYNSNYK